jgi:hypothetical protein
LAVKQLHYIPITPRLKRLFLCEETTQQKRWHKEGICDSEDDDIMSHPTDAKAWHALDRFDPEFARDPRVSVLVYQWMVSNLRALIVLRTLCWSVFVMPYNLPPNKCLKEGFIFISLVTLGPKETKKQMNIFSRSLMEELKELWHGVDAYDNHLKCRFNLHAAYLWSIHHYLAHDKFVGWCVHS